MDYLPNTADTKELAAAVNTPSVSTEAVKHASAQSDEPNHSTSASDVQNNAGIPSSADPEQEVNLPMTGRISPSLDKSSSHENTSMIKASFESSMQEIEVIGSSDNEDMITVFTGQARSNGGQGISSNTSLPSRKDTRPDYSSTTSESGDDLSAYPGTKFFLESDVPYSDMLPSTTQLASIGRGKTDAHPVLDKSTCEHSHADVGIYLRCIRCIRLHVACDRKLPHCSKCTSVTECVYPKRDGRNENIILKSFAIDERQQQQDTLQHNLSSKGPKKSSKSITPDFTKLKPAIGTKTITWIDGDVQHSQKKCPTSVVKQIERHLAEFENTVIASLWPKIKTCYYDCGRALMFVDELSDREVPVARYRYGDKFQFFVVWYPKEGDKLVPAIFRFKVYRNEPATPRNGKKWKPVHWHTWVARGTHHKARVIIRYIEDKQPKLHFVPPQEIEGASIIIGSQQPEVVDTEQSLPSRKRRLHEYGWSSASDGDEDIPFRTQSVQVSKSNVSTSSSVKRPQEGSITAYGHGDRLKRRRRLPWGDVGTFADAKSTESTQNHVTRASTKTVATQLNDHLPCASSVAELVKKKKIGLTCVFKDKQEEIKGVYPFDECDTAQKLFDVACVAQIAQVEPPTTRLLKVHFEGGGEGRVRPDNNKDFANVFETELKRLNDTPRRGHTLKVIISPYL